MTNPLKTIRKCKLFKVGTKLSEQSYSFDQVLKIIDMASKDGYEKALDDNNILHGEAAERFLKEMKENEERGHDPKKEKFLKECDEIYRKTKRD